MIKCGFCGRQNEDNSNFCSSCGQRIGATQTQDFYSGYYTGYDNDLNVQEKKDENQGFGQGYNGYNQGYNGYNQGYNGYGQRQYNPNEKNIILYIFLTIITCGVMGLVWMASINDDINRRVGDNQAMSGGMVVLLTVVTCGIYGYFWSYKMGEKYDYLKGDRGGNSAVLFLILTVFGLIIVNNAIMQDYLNKN